MCVCVCVTVCVRGIQCRRAGGWEGEQERAEEGRNYTPVSVIYSVRQPIRTADFDCWRIVINMSVVFIKEVTRSAHSSSSFIISTRVSCLIDVCLTISPLRSSLAEFAFYIACYIYTLPYIRILSVLDDVRLYTGSYRGRPLA